MKFKLGELVDIRRGSSPRPIKAYLAESGMPWVKISDATKTNTRYISQTEQYIKESGAKNSVIVNQGDLILSNSGTAGLPKFMNITACIHDGWQTFYNYRGIEKEYLYYFLLYIRSQLLHNAYDSTMKNLTLDMLRDTLIDLPSTINQRRIMYILSTLDNKIELNNKLNDNLQQLAEATFKSWFIEFEPFKDKGFCESDLGNIPMGWRASVLEEVSIMSAGGDKPKIFSKEYTMECPVPVFSNGIEKDGLYGYTNIAKIYEESVTVSARGTIGFVCLRQMPYVPIVRLVSLIPRNGMLSSKYLYLWLKLLNISGTGTTQQQLTIPDFKKTKILIPTNNIMKKFTDTVNPLYLKIKANKFENETLANLRDTLLPKLMSGKLT